MNATINIKVEIPEKDLNEFMSDMGYKKYSEKNAKTELDAISFDIYDYFAQNNIKKIITIAN